MTKKEANLGSLFMTFLLIVVALGLTPTVATSVSDALANLTGTSANLMPLVTVFWVLLIISIGVAAAYKQFQTIQG